MAPRKLIFYWALYGFLALVLLLVQSLLLNHLQISGVHPFLLPCVAVLTAVYTSRRGGCIFAFLFGFVCDALFIGAIPCFYLLVFTLCAFGAGLLSHRFLSPGFFCSLLVSAVSVFFTSLFQMFFLSFRSDVPLLSGLHLLALELALTVPFILILHPLYSRIHRFLANV